MKTITKLLIHILCFVLLFFGSETKVNAAEEVASGEYGENATWTLTDDGVFTVSGTGTMTDFGFGKMPWQSYKADIIHLVINEGITSVETHAFYQCENMTSVQLPKTLEKIGNQAFEDCVSLPEINFPSGLKEIGSFAFAGCSSFKSITIPSSVEILQSTVFSVCSELESVKILAPITEIPYSAFSNCGKLTSVEYPQTVTKIGDSAFFRCSGLKEAPITENIVEIGKYAFRDCSNLQSAVLPENLEKLGASAFSSCTKLESIEIPGTLEEIGASAFSSCTSLSNVIINSGIKKIGNGSFQWCEALEKIEMPDSVIEMDEDAFSGCVKLADARFSENLSIINAGVFTSAAIEKLTLPESVTRIEDGYGPIYQASLDGEDDTLRIPEVSDVNADGRPTTGAFAQCGQLKEVYIPKALTYIGFNGLPKNNPTPEQIAEYEWTQGMLKEYKEWYNKKLFTTKGVEGVYSSNWITTKKSIFAIGSTGGSGYSFPATNEFTLGACMVPYSNNNPVYVTQGPTLTVLNNINMIKAGTNDDAVKYAWKFIKYLTNEKVNADLCTTNSEGYVPVRTSAYSTTEFINFLNSKTQYVLVAKVIVEDMQHNYFSTPAFKGSANLRDQVAGCFADVMKLSKTLSDDDLEAAIKVILDRTIDQSVPKM